MLQSNDCFFAFLDALEIISESARHANDSMKKTVSHGWGGVGWVVEPFTKVLYVRHEGALRDIPKTAAK